MTDPIASVSEDYLFNEFKKKGLVDAELDTKLNDYRTNLSTNSNNTGNYFSCGDNVTGNSPANDYGSNNFNTCGVNANTMNLSMKIEFNILKSSLDSCSTQLYNMNAILTMKDKKLAILENALGRIEDRARKREEIAKLNVELNNELNVKVKTEDEANNNTGIVNSFKRNRKTNSVNIPNVTEFLINEDVSNISFKNKNNANAKVNVDVSVNVNNDIVKRELEKLKQNQNKEIEIARDNFAKELFKAKKNEKMKFEDKLRDISADNLFLLNSLQDEADFTKNKLNIKADSVIDIKTHNKLVDNENLDFSEKKRNLIEKIDYYKAVLANNLNLKNNNVESNPQSNATKDNQINTTDLADTDIKILEVGNSGDNNSNNSIKVNTQIKYTKGHFRSQSLNSLFAKKTAQNSLTNIEYDINFNTNQESFYSSSKVKDNSHIKSLQLVYTLDNQEMRPITKSSNQKISFDKKPTSSKTGAFGKINTNSTATPLKKINTGINPEDYISNSANLEIHSIRAFNSKFINLNK